MTIISALGFTLFGVIAGALLLARWWASVMRDPEKCREMLKGMRAKAGEAHTCGGCPCCGWVDPQDGKNKPDESLPAVEVAADAPSDAAPR